MSKVTEADSAALDGWNYADVFEAIAERFPDAPALVQGARRFTWADFDHRADGIAATLIAHGLGRTDKVAQYLYNCPEYLESMFGMFKIGAVPINTNYRYGVEEIAYLWDNADIVAVVFGGTFAETCEDMRRRRPEIRVWLWVDDGGGRCPEWAVAYEEAAASATTRTMAPSGRNGDDLYMLYTGGTTGMPKGVMWRQDDLVVLNDAGSRNRFPTEASRAALYERVTKPGYRTLPAAPLMHGTGALVSFTALTRAGCVVLLESRSFSPIELLDTIEREHVNSISIVGDAFAKPILRALDAEPGRWDLSHLRIVISSGTMFSEETKQGLLRHDPSLLLVDMLGSSEAVGMGRSITNASDSVSTAKFRLGPHARVIDEHGKDVVPGSGQSGRLALGGRVPLGYYKDEAKTASTFLTIDGERYSVPGDWAVVEADGTLTLLGRGSVCINTGGEKVYPEEVEEVLKTHPTVVDAVVVGVPDERFGQAVVALVQAEPGATAVDEHELIAHVKVRLAGYKVPKRVLVVETAGRSPTGKVDYPYLTGLAKARLGVS
jgi:acyl-CoA synthetase (AMP-forming)/AMP-acid ligase II